MYLSPEGYQLLKAKLDGLTKDCHIGVFATSKDDAVRQVIVIGSRIEDLKKVVDSVVQLDGPVGPA
jgi:hypothetical protein